MRKPFWTLPVILAFVLSFEAAGQTPSAVGAEQVAPQPLIPGLDASEIRSQFREVLVQYPTTVQEVFLIDPALMTDENYLSLYPALAAFLEQYPEVAHNPSYFVGTRRTRNNNNGLETIGAALIIATLALTAGWLIRTMIDHVRWSRMSKVQAEVHSKLLDRFTANQELLAYIETPAGRRFRGSRSTFSPDNRTPVLELHRRDGRIHTDTEP